MLSVAFLHFFIFIGFCCWDCRYSGVIYKICDPVHVCVRVLRDFLCYFLMCCCCFPLCYFLPPQYTPFHISLYRIWCITKTTIKSEKCTKATFHPYDGYHSAILWICLKTNRKMITKTQKLLRRQRLLRPPAVSCINTDSHQPH